MQATGDVSDELRRNSSKRNSSDGDSACSREHTTDGGRPALQGTAAAAPNAATTAAAVAAELQTDPFAAWRVAQGLAAANNAAARAGWAAAGRLPIAALINASAVGGGAAVSGENAGTVPAAFAFPLANGVGHPPAPWTGYGTSLLNGGHNGASPSIRQCCTPPHDMLTGGQNELAHRAEGCGTTSAFAASHSCYWYLLRDL